MTPSVRADRLTIAAELRRRVARLDARMRTTLSSGDYLRGQRDGLELIAGELEMSADVAEADPAREDLVP